MSTAHAQRSISKIWLRAARAQLAFAVLLITPAMVVAQSTDAPAYQVLYSFANPPDGSVPLGSLVRDAKGNLYGTASGDGANGWGTVFKLDKFGKETVLHSFTNLDGFTPQAGLVRDQAGNLYGTTSAGGALQCGSGGCGTIFKLSPTGKLTVLHNFTGGEDGEFPLYGSLLMDAKGNLYGTTSGGGAYSRGTVFKATTTFKETVLHSFTGADGASPTSGLIQDEAGNFYGTTESGGTNYQGTVFKLDKHSVETVIYNFTGGPDGGGPAGSLVRDASGNVYGTTVSGGLRQGVCSSYGCGVVFKVDASGKETVLYNFCSQMNCQDGVAPWAGLFLDARGNLYGTTVAGGDSSCHPSFGCGVVFKLDRNGKETVLHKFAGPTGDGQNP